MNRKNIALVCAYVVLSGSLLNADENRFKLKLLAFSNPERTHAMDSRVEELDELFFRSSCIHASDTAPMSVNWSLLRNNTLLSGYGKSRQVFAPGTTITDDYAIKIKDLAAGTYTVRAHFQVLGEADSKGSRDYRFVIPADINKSSAFVTDDPTSGNENSKIAHGRPLYLGFDYSLEGDSTQHVSVRLLLYTRNKGLLYDSGVFRHMQGQSDHFRRLPTDTLSVGETYQYEMRLAADGHEKHKSNVSFQIAPPALFVDFPSTLKADVPELLEILPPQDWQPPFSTIKITTKEGLAVRHHPTDLNAMLVPIDTSKDIVSSVSVTLTDRRGITATMTRNVTIRAKPKKPEPVELAQTPSTGEPIQLAAVASARPAWMAQSVSGNSLDSANTIVGKEMKKTGTTIKKTLSVLAKIGAIAGQLGLQDELGASFTRTMQVLEDGGKFADVAVKADALLVETHNVLTPTVTPARLQPLGRRRISFMLEHLFGNLDIETLEYCKKEVLLFRSLRGTRQEENIGELSDYEFQALMNSSADTLAKKFSVNLSSYPEDKQERVEKLAQRLRAHNWF